MFFDEFVISGLDELQGARIRLCEADAATITKIDARPRNNPPGGVARMEADFRESEPLLQANCFSAALPGAHALGRVRCHMARGDGDASGTEQYFSRPQRRGKSWRNGDADFPKIFSHN